MTDDIETQLKNLLLDLGSDDEQEEPITAEQEPSEQVIQSTQEDIQQNIPEQINPSNGLDDLEDSEDLGIPSEIVLEKVDPAEPVKKRDPGRNAELIAPTKEVQDEPIFDLRAQFEQLNDITHEVIVGTRSDRAETQNTIDMLRGEIDKNIAAGRDAPRAYLDNLVNALGVKSEINMTAVKALEVKAKFLAAAKSGLIINNNNNLGGAGGGTSLNVELNELLNNNPLGAEDEY